MDGQNEPQLECDIVMKGGITSGVVYPRAAAHLAEKYRFRNVGGASAGAIAATFVAAAECGRNSGRNPSSFDQLAQVPTEMGAGLADLFQPSPKTKTLYDVLMAAVTPRPTTSSSAASSSAASAPTSVPAPAAPATPKSKLGLAKILAVAKALVKAELALVLSVALLSLAIPVAVLIYASVTGTLNWFLILLIALFGLIAALVITVVVVVGYTIFRALGALKDNEFGICDGHTQIFAETPPLTDYMTTQLNQLAGLDPNGAPLTIGDLWGAQAVADFRAAISDEKGFLELSPREQDRLRSGRVVDLEVMTTNLTLRRPYRFPFESRQFFFCERCFAKYFPSAVLERLVLSSTPVDDKPVSWTGPDGTRQSKMIVMDCPLHDGTRVRHFPLPPDVPVVVAARISLSFPALISAVPLCYVDYGREPEYVNIIVVWFSDGGIASNFPMNLFDSLWPTRPTFGIDLEKLDGVHGQQQTYLPTREEPRSYDITSMVEFLHGILDTMQNWVDTTQLSMSTYRKRVVEVRLDDEEGGINLKMPAPLIGKIAGLGEDAAKLLDNFDLETHQKMRFSTAMTLLDDQMAQLRASDQRGFRSVVEQAPAPLQSSAGDVLTLAGKWAAEGYPADDPHVPHPTPDLRMVPRE